MPTLRDSTMSHPGENSHQVRVKAYYKGVNISRLVSASPQALKHKVVHPSPARPLTHIFTNESPLTLTLSQAQRGCVLVGALVLRGARLSHVQHSRMAVLPGDHSILRPVTSVTERRRVRGFHGSPERGRQTLPPA
ncbi:hypothetical protein NQZ68_001343 [Dissostichus eleginoides]|nr:hypothetical protein NQZ68_001343 [Dissostichus eleginoides]